MMHQLRYGESATLELDVPAETLVAACTQVPGTVLDDPAAAAAAALMNPVHFPPISQAVVPGDRVVIALDPEVPRAGPIVAGAIQAVLAASVQPEQITVLQASQQERTAELAGQLPGDARQVQFAVHDPEDPEQLAYLAASKDAAPIHLNRLLCDADLVLPINLLRPESALLYSGPHSGLCPTFSDSETQRRFRTPNTSVSRSQQRRRREEADEIAWLLGIQLSLQIVAGAGESVLHILAGLDEDVTRLGRELVQAAWGYEVAKRAKLVVATIEGEQSEQTWKNFGRALHAAQQVCVANGTIVLCTELTCKPGHALKRLASLEDKEKLLKRIGNDRSEDALSAWLLLEARDAAHVFLLSHLDESAVESLGAGYVDSPQHIDRILSQYDSCILLANAHRAAPQTT